jgi:hypothetical protein
MKRYAQIVVAAVLITAAIAIPAGPAQAEPCGASSWMSGSTQYVGYRNCGGSVMMLKAHIDGVWSRWCLGVPAYGSGVLYYRSVNAMKPWGVAPC